MPQNTLINRVFGELNLTGGELRTNSLSERHVADYTLPRKQDYFDKCQGIRNHSPCLDGSRNRRCKRG